MTDSLRDRIAAAIKAVDVMPSNDFDPYVEMADAVIAELGMGIPCSTAGCRMQQIAQQAAARHEVVEDWHGKAGSNERP